MEKYKFVNFYNYTFHEKSRILQSFLKEDEIILFCKPRIDLEKDEYDEELDLVCEEYLEKNTVFINNYFLDEDGICEVCNEICWIKTNENVSIADYIEIFSQFACIIVEKGSRNFISSIKYMLVINDNGSLLIHAKDKTDFDNRVFESIQRIDNTVRKRRKCIRNYLKSYSYKIELQGEIPYTSYKDIHMKIINCLTSANEDVFICYRFFDKMESLRYKVSNIIDNIKGNDKKYYYEEEKKVARVAHYTNGIDVDSIVSTNDETTRSYWCNINEIYDEEWIGISYSCVIINPELNFEKYSYMVMGMEDYIFIFDNNRTFMKDSCKKIKSVFPNVKKKGNNIKIIIG